MVSPLKSDVKAVHSNGLQDREGSCEGADVPLVYRLHRPHRVGSICGVPCQQCGGDEAVMTGVGDVGNGYVEPLPLFILREATYGEYVASATANGGGRCLAPNTGYFYEVSVD